MTSPIEKSPMGKLREVLAPNSSPMTGPGTTSFILGEGLVTIIDPGPDDDAHLAALLGALAPHERIEAILITHPHLDHSALTPRLCAQSGAKSYAFGPAGAGRTPLMQRLAKEDIGGGEGVDLTFIPDQTLPDGAKLQLACGTIKVLHTPGHMAEHLAFGWGDTLFCGDLIMAWAPSLISPPDGDMGAYLASLKRISSEQWRVLRPTHGAAINDPASRIAEIIAHRREREGQILATLNKGPLDLNALTQSVYAGLTPLMMAAARRNALAHLIDLEARGLIERQGARFEQSRYSLKRQETSL